ncbi:MAG: PilZ domain-containing protein [Desulfosarcina sp.]|nr:PilZ domain-containing protein [Desulfobacterales bacterium]
MSNDRRKVKPGARKALPNECRLHDRTLCTEGTHFLSKKRLYEGTIKNISKGGTYIQTDGYFTVGQEITVAGPFESDGRECKQQGAIVRKDRRGIGVKFKRVFW